MNCKAIEKLVDELFEQNKISAEDRAKIYSSIAVYETNDMFLNNIKNTARSVVKVILSKYNIDMEGLQR